MCVMGVCLFGTMIACEYVMGVCVYGTMIACEYVCMSIGI